MHVCAFFWFDDAVDSNLTKSEDEIGEVHSRCMFQLMTQASIGAHGLRAHCKVAWNIDPF